MREYVNGSHRSGFLKFWGRSILNPRGPCRFIILALPEEVPTEVLIKFLENGFPWPVKELDL